MNFQNYLQFFSQYVQAIIDEDLTNESMGSKILAAANISYKLTNSVIPRTIYWQRTEQQTLKGADNQVCFAFQKHVNDLIKFVHSF